MNNVKGSSVFAAFTALAVCGTLAVPAHAWSWPWEKASAAPTTQTSSSATNAPSSNAPAVVAAVASKPAAAAAADPKKDVIVSGTVESVDAKDTRLILKTSAGKSETFTLAKSFVILKHHRKLAPTALKAGERVNVYCRPHSNEAVRVNLLGSQKV